MTPSGRSGAGTWFLPDVCFVAYVRDGRISLAFEYVDTGQVDRFLPPSDAEPAGV